MNTMKDILTVCGIAGIGMFFGYVLGFVEGNGEVKSKSEKVKSGREVTRGREVKSESEEVRNSSVEDASAHPSRERSAQ